MIGYYKIKDTALWRASTPYRRALRLAMAPFYLGGRFQCPVCKVRLRRFAGFKPSFSRPSRRAKCPFCASMERTRHIWLYLEASGLLDGDCRMLHVAPERGLANRLRAKGLRRYVSIDLTAFGVDAFSDLCHLPFATDAFDVVYCSNVLEHIVEDRLAIAELFRVLRPGGAAILQVPIRGEQTQEDPAVTSLAERDRLYGQPDHVRYYGHDFKERLAEAGFQVEECRMPQALGLPDDEVIRLGLDKEEPIYICSKDG